MKKKALYISYNGLLEPILPSQTMPYLKILAKNGFEFILLTFEKPRDLKRTGRKGLRRMREELRREGIQWRWLIYHKYPAKISTFLDILAGFAVSLYLVTTKNIKVIHLRGITPGTIGLLLPRVSGFKILFDTRGLLAEEYAGGGIWKDGSLFFNMAKAAQNSLMRRADAVVILTKRHYEKTVAVPRVIKRNASTDVIPCCVDLDRFRCDTQDHGQVLGKYRIKPGVLFVYPGKIGTFYLVEEMLGFYAQAASMISGTKFLILSQDPKERMKERAGTLLENNGIHFIRPSFEEIPLFLRCASAGLFFINPYKKFGSSPIKLGEFLACGRPVIINPGIGDTEELVAENRVGVVVRDFSKGEYSRKICELMDLLKEGRELDKRCRMTAEKYLSLEMGAGRYLNIYKRLSG
jgi:glycosyltransferase involved in cell wall biosynthesis